MTPAIEVRGLRKVFRARERSPGLAGAIRSLVAPRSREIVAVEDLAFSIAPGERVAFLGPNGAGKSTTIKMLSGILHPTAGEARVLGLDPSRERTRLAFRIGTVFGQRTQLWWHLPARDTLDLLAAVYEIPAAEYRERRDRLVESFGVGPLLDRPVRGLSLGERMRCEIVASLLHRPEVLFLDEPTIGLDVEAKAAVRDLVLRASAERGTTLLLTSHDPSDMERVCDRAIVIHQGRLLLDRPVAALREGFLRTKLVTLDTVEAPPAVDLPGVTVSSRDAHRVVLHVDTARTPVESVVAAAMAAGRLRDLTVADPPMEDVVRAIYAAAGNGSGAGGAGE
ncbi:MAG: ATP-binding cassette domain-containing protein [Planctomycetales bacterium]|nr:ATP-binding cassette domain-containing protein [Planctomycetales bacterium]